MSAITSARVEQTGLFATPKRGPNERSGVHAWFPYYAGFSAAFVTEVLHSLSLPGDAVVLDPMNGSGTTTLVSQREGFNAIGNELNPAMAIIARAKDASLANRADELDSALARVNARFQSLNASETGREYGQANASDSYRVFRRIREAVRSVPDDEIPAASAIASCLRNGIATTTGMGSLLTAALLVAVRRHARPRGSKNPTWFKPGAVDKLSDQEAWASFESVTRQLQRDLNSFFVDRPRQRRVAVLEGDARDLEVRTSSIDAIITSPPYLTRIDYAVSTAPELTFLGYESKSAFHAIRSAIMGSTCVIPGEHLARESWGTSCNEVLARVYYHPSKASRTYYYKTSIQYFRDAEALVRESLRVLKPGAAAFFVVQDSWYKDVHVPLDRIYCELATRAGACTAEVINRVAVRSHLGLVNTRARKYKKGDLAEHVVRFVKRPADDRS